jgi:lipid-A-disaccharide synthase
VLYRIGWLDLKVGKCFMVCKYISLVNLLADKRLFPEYLTDRCEAEAVTRDVVGWLNDPASYKRVREELAAVRGRVARPGTCDRVAEYVLEVLGRGASRRVA